MAFARRALRNPYVSGLLQAAERVSGNLSKEREYQRQQHDQYAMMNFQQEQRRADMDYEQGLRNDASEKAYERSQSQADQSYWRSQYERLSQGTPDERMRAEQIKQAHPEAFGDIGTVGITSEPAFGGQEGKMSPADVGAMASKGPAPDALGGDPSAQMAGGGGMTGAKGGVAETSVGGGMVRAVLDDINDEADADAKLAKINSYLADPTFSVPEITAALEGERRRVESDKTLSANRLKSEKVRKETGNKIFGLVTQIRLADDPQQAGELIDEALGLLSKVPDESFNSEMRDLILAAQESAAGRFPMSDADWTKMLAKVKAEVLTRTASTDAGVDLEGAEAAVSSMDKLRSQQPPADLGGRGVLAQPAGGPPQDAVAAALQGQLPTGGPQPPMFPAEMQGAGGGHPEQSPVQQFMGDRFGGMGTAHAEEGAAPGAAKSALQGAPAGQPAAPQAPPEEGLMKAPPTQGQTWDPQPGEETGLAPDTIEFVRDYAYSNAMSFSQARQELEKKAGGDAPQKPMGFVDTLKQGPPDQLPRAKKAWETAGRAAEAAGGIGDYMSDFFGQHEESIRRGMR